MQWRATGIDFTDLWGSRSSNPRNRTFFPDLVLNSAAEALPPLPERYSPDAAGDGDWRAIWILTLITRLSRWLGTTRRAPFVIVNYDLAKSNDGKAFLLIACLAQFSSGTIPIFPVSCAARTTLYSEVKMSRTAIWWGHGKRH